MAIAYTDVAFGNGYFAACGQNGYIAYATTANATTAFTSLYVNTPNSLNGINYCNTTWIAVGDVGTIVKSSGNVPTGTWTTVTSGTTNNLNHITYGNGVYVVVGNNGTILTSTDAVTWTTRTSGTPLNIYKVRYLNARWIAVGQFGTLLQSTNNGVTWIGGNTDARPLYSIAYNGTTYNAMYKYSSDGVTWTSNYDTSLNSITQPYTLYAASGSSSFVALGMLRPTSNMDSSAGESLVTTNNTSWAYPTYYSFGCKNSSIANNIFWGKGDGNSASMPQTGGYNTSPTLSNPWQYTSYTHFSGYPLTTTWAVTYGGGYYMLLGRIVNGSNSYDACYRGTSMASLSFLVSLGTVNTEWLPVRSPSNNPGSSFDFFYSSPYFVATGVRYYASGVNGAGYYHVIAYTSNNGSNWSWTYFAASNPSPIDNTRDMGSRGTANGSGVMCFSARWYGNGGYVLRTTDLANFGYYYTGYASKINDIKYLNGYFYTVHENGGIARSSDGITWTKLVIAATWTGNTIKDVSYINGYYIFLKDSYHQRTTDLSTFVDVATGANYALINDGTRIISNNFYSTNGTTWTASGSQQFGTSGYNFRAFASSGSTFIGIYSDRIFYSTNLANAWTELAPVVTAPTGTGIILKDENGLERLQSYDPTKANYLCTRLVRVDYVTAAGTVVEVPESNGYKIFSVVMPDFTGISPNGTNAYPYVEYHRGAAPNYTPSYTIRYPSYGGSFTPTNVPGYVVTFTTGQVEQTSY